MKYFIFHCDGANYTVDRWTYSDGKAEVYVNYTSKIEGKQGFVNFTFDYTYVNRKPIPVYFEISSENSKLLYSTFQYKN